jgi:D-alanyl-D-alanine carboxypeptidase (penicillin-binding protein 5/6)
MDVASGRILYAKNAHIQRPPASLTKIMTALVALEEDSQSDKVAVSPEAAGLEGSSIWLEVGEIQTVGDLLYGLMLRSGNDAAVAIAEHVAGNSSDFALLMNRRAAELGATGTHFRNPHGLPVAGHYTTAADLALITREALLRPDFREIVGARRHVIPWPSRPWDRAVYSENRLLWLYPGADGVKTGWTEEAGRCLVASATRDGWQLVTVLLDAPDMWSDATQVMDWGFASFRSVVLYRAGETVTRARVAGAVERWVPLATTQDISVAVLPGDHERVRAEPDPLPFVRAPLAQGAKAGSVRVVVDGVPLLPLPLIAGETVARGGLVGQFFEDLWVVLYTTLHNLISSGE